MPTDLNAILEAESDTDESVSDMENLTDQERAEGDSGSEETEVEEMETEVPPKKTAPAKKSAPVAKPTPTAKASSVSKPSPASKKAAAEPSDSPKVARKRKAGDQPAEKKSKTKPPAKPAAEKRTDSPAPKASAAATPAPAISLKKPSGLPECPGILSIKYRTTQGSTVTVTGSGSNAVSACLTASVIAYGGRREMARRITLQSASATISIPQKGVDLARDVQLLDFDMAIASFTLEALFQLAYELYSSQFQCDPL